MDVFIAQVPPKGEEVKVKKHIRRHGPGQPIRELDAPLYEQSSFQIRVLGESYSILSGTGAVPLNMNRTASSNWERLIPPGRLIERNCTIRWAAWRPCA